MADVPTIFAAIHEILSRQLSWAGKRVLITAGPTREPIDPVRYLSNRSSGKMGYALAEAAKLRGADVILVSGPAALSVPGGIEIVRVETAVQMYDAALFHAETADIIIAAAAVSDYRPTERAEQKLKKTGASPTLTLTQTDDILAELGRRKHPHQILVGFAAETTDLLAQARLKLTSKNLDWIAANDVTQEGAGFDGDTNIVTLVGKDRQEIALPLLTKREVAERILGEIGTSRLASQGPS